MNLNFNRLLHLFKLDLVLHRKIILISTLTFIILCSLLPFHVTATTSMYFFILYVGGFLITGAAFNDLHDKTKAPQYLTLPCSSLERFLSKWLLTSVLYAVTALIIYFLFAWLSVLANLLAFNQQVYPFDILQINLWLGIGKYVLLQAIILLGAMTFKKHALIKTALSLGCFLLVILAISGMLTWMTCPHCANGWFGLHMLFDSRYFNLWIILAPICWCLTYLKLTKYELK